ncbi:MAG: helix-turn-helix domain-containing protein [Acidobacteriales bacterium]|nr:helix-turn-helix domain-containing protein [Terriglobales bacterium]
MDVAIDKLYSTTEAAEKLGIAESLVRRYCLQRRIGSRVGKNWVISEDEIRLFSQIKRQPGRPKAGNGKNNGTSGNDRKSQKAR